LTEDGTPTCSVEAAVAGGYAPASAATHSGEHRLMVAILGDAVALHVKSLSGGSVRRRDAREAREWLASSDRSLPFSFESICDVLGLDSSYIRRGLRGAREQPAETAARFALRYHGRQAGPITPAPPMSLTDTRPVVANVA
jgi:hypothetical protein